MPSGMPVLCTVLMAGSHGKFAPDFTKFEHADQRTCTCILGLDTGQKSLLYVDVDERWDQAAGCSCIDVRIVLAARKS